MKPVIRYQSQLLYRRSYKPIRTFKFRSQVKTITFRPSRAAPVPISWESKSN